MRRVRTGSAVWLLAVTAVGGAVGAARADDWPQFRRDPGRTAVSKDSLRLPLKELWTWSSRGQDGHTPLYHSVTYRGRVFFIARDGAKRSLIAADTRTGAVRWRQPLITPRLRFAVSDAVGPAVTDSGMVYAYDWYDSPDALHKGQSHQSAVEGTSFVVRTFGAAGGQPGPYFPLVAMGANGILPRLSLKHDTFEGQEVRPVPPTFSGCPP